MKALISLKNTPSTYRYYQYVFSVNNQKIDIYIIGYLPLKLKNC